MGDTWTLTVNPPRQPTSETGIYLAVHEHEWTEAGAHRMPVGSWHPIFTCPCGAVIVDMHVTDYVEPGSTCVDCEAPLTADHRCARR